MQALARVTHETSVAPDQPCAGKVLLVEDNEFNCDMLSRRLMRGGWQVEVEVNGMLSLERAHGGAFDLILMDGWTVTPLLKEIPRTCDTPSLHLRRMR